MTAATLRQACAATLLLMLGACATPEPTPAPAPVEAAASADEPVAERLQSQPLKHLANRKLKPMPVQALNVRTKCAFHDEGGTHGKLDLQVKNAKVLRFTAEVIILKHGTCRFDMKNFRQTATLPAVLLADNGSDCLVRIWAQEKGVTVAFNSCQAQCSGESFSYLWPILVDTRNGRCF